MGEIESLVLGIFIGLVIGVKNSGKLMKIYEAMTGKNNQVVNGTAYAKNGIKR